VRAELHAFNAIQAGSRPGNQDRKSMAVRGSGRHGAGPSIHHRLHAIHGKLGVDNRTQAAVLFLGR
jgi:hypothetical protein